jgi:hypothetical protein
MGIWVHPVLAYYSTDAIFRPIVAELGALQLLPRIVADMDPPVDAIEARPAGAFQRVPWCASREHRLVSV